MSEKGLDVKSFTYSQTQQQTSLLSSPENNELMSNVLTWSELRHTYTYMYLHNVHVHINLFFKRYIVIKGTSR